MNSRLEQMKQRVRGSEPRPYRQSRVIDVRAECEAEGLSPMQAAARLTVRMCEAEQPVILPDERIVFTRTLPHPASPFSNAVLGTAKDTELSFVRNICADWGKALEQGLMGRKQVALDFAPALAA